MVEKTGNGKEEIQMGFIHLASMESAWCGYEYYKRGNVETCEKIAPDHYAGKVSGSRKNPYQVTIDLKHPRRSECNCPLANGRRVVCKHMVALYFTAFPKEAEAYHNAVLEAEEEEERRYEKLERALIAHVASMKREALQQALLQVLFEGPPWQFERFVRENLRDLAEFDLR